MPVWSSNGTETRALLSREGSKVITEQEIKSSIREEIAKLKTYERDFDVAIVADDELLFDDEGGVFGLDSLDGLDLVLALQTKFDIDLDEETVDWSEMSTIEKISRLVIKKLEEKSLGA
jgi:acyl carrier protein